MQGTIIDTTQKKYCIITALGSSKILYLNTQQKPLHGIGQGSGATIMNTIKKIYDGCKIVKNF